MELYSLLDKFRKTNQKRTPLKVLRAAVKKVMRLAGVTTMMIVFPMKKANQVIMREIAVDLALSPVMKTHEQNLSQ